MNTQDVMRHLDTIEAALYPEMAERRRSAQFVAWALAKLIDLRG
jgi:hypothetical protein